MRELNFASGLIEFSLNGAVTVTFNPTDTNFVAKIYDAFEQLDAKQEAYKEEAGKLVGKRELFDFSRERDKEMREVLNDLFGVDICTPLFGYMNVYALADGLPVWANLMLAIIDEMDASAAKETKVGDTRLQKYIKKYQKK